MKAFIYACISIFIIGVSPITHAMEKQEKEGVSIRDLIAINKMPELNDDGTLDLESRIISNLSGLEIVPRQQEILNLNLSYNILRTLPPSLFPNLLHLDISYNPLTQLPEGMLEGLVLLKRFIACNTEIVEFPPYFFNNLPRLTQIDTSHNRLKKLPPQLLRGCTQLIEFNLSYNQLTSIPAALIQPLTSLRALNLKGNTQELLSNLPQKIRRIILARSLFIGDSTFFEDEPQANTAQDLIQQLKAEGRFNEIFFECADRPNRFILNLAHRGLSSIDGLAELVPYPGLVIEFNLQNNYLKEIPCGTLNKFRRLKFLDISHNQIQSVTQTKIVQNEGLPSQVTNQTLCLPRLKGLRLANNCLKVLPENAFFHLTRLSELQLSHNAIELIEDGAFSSLENLERCLLNNNKLGGIPPHLFASQETYLHKLKFLDLSHNELGPLSHYIFPAVNTRRYFPQSAQPLQLVTAKQIITLLKHKTPNEKLELIRKLPRNILAYVASKSIGRYLILCNEIDACSSTFDTLDLQKESSERSQEAECTWLHAISCLDNLQWDIGISLFLKHFAEHPLHQKFLHRFCTEKIGALMSISLISLADTLMKLSPTLCDLINDRADENLQKRIQGARDVYSQYLFLTQSRGTRDKAILLAHSELNGQKKCLHAQIKRIESEWSQAIESFKECFYSWSIEMQGAFFELISKKCKSDLAKHGIVLGSQV